MKKLLLFILSFTFCAHISSMRRGAPTRPRDITASRKRGKNALGEMRKAGISLNDLQKYANLVQVQIDYLRSVSRPQFADELEAQLIEVAGPNAPVLGLPAPGRPAPGRPAPGRPAPSPGRPAPGRPALPGPERPGPGPSPKPGPSPAPSQNMINDPYEALGVASNASEREILGIPANVRLDAKVIRRAYINRIKIWHTDKYSTPQELKAFNEKRIKQGERPITFQAAGQTARLINNAREALVNSLG